MQNIKELREALIQDRKKTEEKKMSISTLNALANNAGKILQSCQVEMNEKLRMGDTSPIEFLKTNQTIKIDKEGILPKILSQ